MPLADALEKISTQENVFVTIAAFLEEALRAGDYVRARMYLDMLHCIEAKRDGKQPY